MPEYRRGDIWIADLKPGTHPEEPAKERLCLIVQDSRICAVAQHGTIIVIPISSLSEDPGIEEDDIRVPVGTFPKDPWRPELNAVLASQDAGAEVFLATLSWKRRLTLHHLEIQPDIRCRAAPRPDPQPGWRG